MLPPLHNLHVGPPADVKPNETLKDAIAPADTWYQVELAAVQEPEHVLEMVSVVMQLGSRRREMKWTGFVSWFFHDSELLSQIANPGNVDGILARRGTETSLRASQVAFVTALNAQSPKLFGDASFRDSAAAPGTARVSVEIKAHFLRLWREASPVFKSLLEELAAHGLRGVGAGMDFGNGSGGRSKSKKPKLESGAERDLFERWFFVLIPAGASAQDWHYDSPDGKRGTAFYSTLIVPISQDANSAGGTRICDEKGDHHVYNRWGHGTVFRSGVLHRGDPNTSCNPRVYLMQTLSTTYEDENDQEKDLGKAGFAKYKVAK